MTNNNLPHPKDIKTIVREVRPDTSATEAARVEHGVTLIRLFDAGIPEKAVFDYFAINILGIPREEWLRVRSVTRQALEANIDRAEERLPDAELDPDPQLPSPGEVSGAIRFVERGKYRDRILRALAMDGPKRPSELASEIGVEVRDISRNLRKMRERGLVELLVPEDTIQPRPHGLTILGEVVDEEVRSDG